MESFAQSAEVVLREVLESAKRNMHHGEKTVVVLDAEQPSKPQVERPKIVISIQDRKGKKQYKIYMVCHLLRMSNSYV